MPFFFQFSDMEAKNYCNGIFCKVFLSVLQVQIFHLLHVFVASIFLKDLVGDCLLGAGMVGHGWVWVL